MANAPSKKVRPREFKGFLLNPHKGCQTFQRFNGDPFFIPGSGVCHEEGPLTFPERQFEGITPGYLPSTVSYCRWFWEVLEAVEGRYDFTAIDRSLETAAARGQTLHVRLMPFGSPKQPPLPKWYVAKYPTVERERFNAKYLAPVHDGPEYLAKWGGLISEFGRRYDGDPRLECVDMSYKGAWGEGDGECSDAGIDRITKVYVDAHPKTPVLAMIGGYMMTAGVRAGTGWRCDSCDDLGLWGDPAMGPQGQWNHLYDSYPWSMTACGAQEAWKTAPVAYEPGGTMKAGFDKGFDLDFIIRQDLKYHGSLISFKSYELPAPWMDKLRMFMNDLGYRFVLRQVRFDARIKRGEPIEWGAWVENVGVAPIYRRYAFAIRATQGNRVQVHRSDADITKWLPGDACPAGAIKLPADFQPGTVMLHAGLVDAATNAPAVRFAVEGADADCWVPLDSVEVV